MPILLAVDALEAKIRNIRLVSLKQGSMFPDEMMRYDSFTIRESLHNCIAHQDYTMGARIEVVEFEDEKLIFRNAGTFIPKSVEEVIENDCPESVYRNPFLVEAMRNLGMIETQGGGIKKLFDLQNERDFPPPLYEFSDSSIKLTIFGSSEKSSEKILELLKENNKLTTDEVAEKIGITRRAVEKNIEKLKSKGKLTRIGADNGGYWQVI